MTRISEAQAALKALQIELAIVQDQLAGPRLRWRGVTDSIAAQIMVGDEQRRVLAFWKPLGADNIATLNAERARFLSDVGDLPSVEKTLRAAIRKAEIDLRAVQKEARESTRKTPKTPPQTAQMSLF